MGEPERAVLEFVEHGEPDARLPRHLMVTAQEMIRCGVLRLCGCSDGDYLVLSDAFIKERRKREGEGG